MHENSTCRLCEKWEGPKVRYGIRHYAHADCGLKKWGSLFFDKLSLHELNNFPALTASKHGQLKNLAARIESLNAQQRSRERRLARERGEQ